MVSVRIFYSILLIAASVQTLAYASDVRGAVIIKQKLTRQRVTAAVSVYERGPAVQLHSDAGDNALATERERVVVYLEGPGPATNSTGVAATIEQKDRRFVPELVVVSAGSAVSFPNLDPIFHNVFSLSKPKSFDLGNYPKDHTRTVTFTKPGIEFVNCHLHPNMSATIVVTPNRWHAVADRSGQFVLRDVPAGKYTVVAWHKAVGFFRQTVNVLVDRSASVEFFLPLGEEMTPKVEARR